MTTRIRKGLVITSLVATILPVGATGAFAVAPPRVRISAEVQCLPEGGIGIDLTLENEGTRVARIDPDIHLLIEPVRVGGPQPGVILFIFPAPNFARIPPGESRTFLLMAGEPFEGEPPADFSGSRILMELEVWLRHRDRPLTRTLSFPACG